MKTAGKEQLIVAITAAEIWYVTRYLFCQNTNKSGTINYHRKVFYGRFYILPLTDCETVFEVNLFVNEGV